MKLYIFRHAGFLQTFLLLPLVIFLPLFLLVRELNVDFILADWLYTLEGNSWSLRDAVLTSSVLHKGGRILVDIFTVAWLSLILVSQFTPSWRHLRRPLLYVFVTALTSVVAINLLKIQTHVDCPWDLIRYGGSRPGNLLPAAMADVLKTGYCFPAGHASAGYCWFGLFFMARWLDMCKRNLILASVVLVGLIFGISQQLRGAHFLTHDMVTLLICWVCAVLYAVIFRLTGDTVTTRDSCRRVNNLPIRL